MFVLDNHSIASLRTCNSDTSSGSDSGSFDSINRLRLVKVVGVVSFFDGNSSTNIKIGENNSLTSFQSDCGCLSSARNDSASDGLIVFIKNRGASSGRNDFVRITSLGLAKRVDGRGCRSQRKGEVFASIQVARIVRNIFLNIKALLVVIILSVGIDNLGMDIGIDERKVSDVFSASFCRGIGLLAFRFNTFINSDYSNGVLKASRAVVNTDTVVSCIIGVSRATISSILGRSSFILVNIICILTIRGARSLESSFDKIAEMFSLGEITRISEIGTCDCRSSFVALIFIFDGFDIEFCRRNGCASGHIQGLGNIDSINRLSGRSRIKGKCHGDGQSSHHRKSDKDRDKFLHCL